MPTGATVARGLSMPHSPRWHDGRLWILESGTGRLVLVDIATGRQAGVVDLPGFARGLTLCGPYAFVGLSRIRKSSAMDGVPLAVRREQLKCGVAVVDLRNGQMMGLLEILDGDVRWSNMRGFDRNFRFLNPRVRSWRAPYFCTGFMAVLRPAASIIGRTFHDFRMYPCGYETDVTLIRSRAGGPMKDAGNNSREEPGTETPGPTSRTLLDRVKAGDERSRQRLSDLYRPLVYHRYLARVPRQDRHDLVQEVFATVFEKIGGFEKQFDGPAFRGWLYRIALPQGRRLHQAESPRGAGVGRGRDPAGRMRPGHVR